MNVKYLSMLFLCAFSIAAQYNPQITSVKSGWNQWGTQISSMHFESRVAGIVARTVLTISFKDVRSTVGTDSMEVNFNFNLPSKSVVDSMYLWINGTPQSAALKERWSAVSAYWQVVGRRWDPALLTKWSGDAYNLRIFPFSHGQERTVRICYTTPLSVQGGNLSVSYPLDIACGSAIPVQSLTGNIVIENSIDRIIIPTLSNMDIVKSPASTSGSTSVSFSSSKIVPLKPLTIGIMDRGLEETGMCASLAHNDSTGTSFIALIEPKLVTGATNTRPKNILVVWNLVSENRYNYYNEQPTADKSYSYNEYSMQSIRSGMDVLLSRYMQQGDRLNLIVNDGTLKRLYQTQTDWSAETQGSVSEFIQQKISKVNKNEECLSPLEFLQSSLQGISDEKQLDLILIDQTYSYSYNYDTSKIDVETNKLLKKLPENTTVFGLIGYNQFNAVARIQNGLIQRKGGMAFYSWGDMTEIFGSIGRSLTPRIYPASVTFTSGSNTFVYDVIGPLDDRIFLGVPVVYTGKISGKAESFQINFTYDLNGVVYQKKRTFTVDISNTDFDGVEKLWASARVDKLLLNRSATYAYNEFSEALNLSLKYRILTNQTALIAFEPGLMSEEWYTDDQKGTNATTGIALPVIHSLEASVPAQPVMQAAFQSGYLKVNVRGINMRSKTTSFTLKLYDLKGRVIADLTSKAIVNTDECTAGIRTGGLATGMYIVKFVLGKTVLQRTITVRS